MKARTRTHNAVLNATLVGSTQIIIMICQFILQSVFIRMLGTTYLGLHGLFLNLFTLLSFAELGVGSAITFALFKPLKEKNFEEILSLVNWLRKLYQKVALIMFVGGLILLPFLNLIVDDIAVIGSMVYVYFLLALTSSTSVYLVAHKRILLLAEQRTYIDSLNQLVFTTSMITLQVISLFIWQNFFLFLVINLLFTLFSNLRISLLVNKLYADVFSSRSVKVKSEQLKEIKKNTLGLVGSKIGEIVILNTENIFISAFVGLASAGIFLSYQMVLRGLQSIVNQAINAVVATFGNLRLDENREKEYNIYKKSMFINWALSYFLCIFLLTLFNEFVSMWLGESYLFSWQIVVLMVINYYVLQMRSTQVVFIKSQGLFVKVGIKSIIEAIFSLLLIVIFVVILDLGIIGVLFASLGVNVLLNLWVEPWIVHKYGFGKKLSLTYFITYVGGMILTFSSGLGIYYVLPEIQGLLGFILRLAIVFVFSTTIFISLFHKREEFKVLKELSFRMMKMLRNKKDLSNGKLEESKK